MNDIVRKVIVSAPMAACVLMLAWYWLGEVDRPERGVGLSPTVTALVGPGVVNARATEHAESTGDAGTFSSWMSYQRELDDRAAPENMSDTAASEPAPEELSTPEPVYQQDSQASSEQRISEAAFRAVRGQTAQMRAAALGELAVIGDATVLDTLGEALADPEPRVQLAAVTSARRLAQYHGDVDGEVQNWLTQIGSGAGNSADPRVAAAARDGANELAQNQGQDLPFP